MLCWLGVGVLHCSCCSNWRVACFMLLRLVCCMFMLLELACCMFMLLRLACCIFMLLELVRCMCLKHVAEQTAPHAQ